jgi:putative tryptophan/tyrosine transport system substrate-binding protein
MHLAQAALLGSGLEQRDFGQQAARCAPRILTLSPPADLAVEAVSRNSLAINLKTARAIGLTIPQFILARAILLIE